MEGSIIFYTYGSTLELNGQQFEAGRLTEDLLNLSPDDYHPLHERMVRIRTLMDIYEYVRKSELWWKLNDEMEQLCQELRRYTVFRLLPDDCYDAFFSVIREITGQFSLFPPEEHSLSEDDQTKLLSASAEEFFQSDDGDSDPEISLGLLDLFRRREGSEEKGELFYYEMFRLLGACEDTWSAYKKYIDRYMMYLHDIRAFVPTIRNFIKFILSTLTTNGPESYAAALYGFYNDDRTAEKLIVNPITYHGDCYRRHDEYMLSYVPRELPDGSMAICQEHVTDSLQALMKADYMLALNTVAWLRTAGYDPGKVHIQSSYGLWNLPAQPCDYVRAGIALYGVRSDDAPVQRSLDLRPVLSLRARVASIRTVQAGESAGYGRVFQAEQETKLAVVTIGYADGLPRDLPQRGGQVLIQGRRCPMVGRMCMDQLLVDVSDLSEVAPDDTVTIIGRDGGQVIRAEELAACCGTITNELLSRLGMRLPIVSG